MARAAWLDLDKGHVNGNHLESVALVRHELARSVMPEYSPRQRKITGRVIHEIKHRELKSRPGGKAGKVKDHRQAIAIP